MEVDALFQLNDRHSGGRAWGRNCATPENMEVIREPNEYFYMFVVNPKP